MNIVLNKINYTKQLAVTGILFGLSIWPFLNAFGQEQNPKPNVLWILIENIGPEFSSYGYPHVKTPNIDKLASGGAIYQNAFTNSPVCSPSRSSLITGMYPNAIGVHHHRSMRQLPDSIETLLKYLTEQDILLLWEMVMLPKKTIIFQLIKNCGMTMIGSKEGKDNRFLHS